jgi:uncharacterized membrane protein YphA (DoxX/SURF4 family)
VARTAPWLGLGVRLLAAAIWIVAGAAKITDLEHFHAQVHAYRLLPAALELPFAYALPFVEVALGLYLVVGLLVRPAAILACALMIAFVAAMAQAWARGLSLDCGCFGSLAREPVGLTAILRDAALGVPSLVIALRPPRLFSLDRFWLGLPDRLSIGRAPNPSAKLRARAATRDLPGQPT